LRTLSPETYRQQVSYCVQTPSLFGDTVYDNLIFPWKIRGKTPEPEKFITDLAQFGLAQETLTKSVSELSGGEKQRVSLIRNLQFLPKVLLLDEITSALDESNKRNVNDIIHRYAREQHVAVLWVTHDANEIAHADGANGANQPGQNRAGTDVAIPGPVVVWHLFNHRRETTGFGQRKAHNHQNTEVLQGAVQQSDPGHALHAAKGEIEGADDCGNKRRHGQVNLEDRFCG
jgi:ABC-type sulfate/molybdate transport systems ATPase subunit